ncbi:hypothetical protein FNV43_RR06503 [Rhamnella rubrinervis]|uniref:Uncharacterized protein n=1 Tax=Rhamnella rubrinervis TaxID=2594499 RepID=A0A8K0HD29_9ROSA|nr:hypothetical protein FNV43_RR06503 [Rhamnella rubrinervis]
MALQSVPLRGYTHPWSPNLRSVPSLRLNCPPQNGFHPRRRLFERPTGRAFPSWALPRLSKSISRRCSNQPAPPRDNFRSKISTFAGHGAVGESIRAPCSSHQRDIYAWSYLVHQDEGLKP